MINGAVVQSLCCYRLNKMLQMHLLRYCSLRILPNNSKSMSTTYSAPPSIAFFKIALPQSLTSRLPEGRADPASIPLALGFGATPHHPCRRPSPPQAIGQHRRPASDIEPFRPSLPEGRHRDQRASRLPGGRTCQRGRADRAYRSRGRPFPAQRYPRSPRSAQLRARQAPPPDIPTRPLRARGNFSWRAGRCSASQTRPARTRASDVVEGMRAAQPRILTRRAASRALLSMCRRSSRRQRRAAQATRGARRRGRSTPWNQDAAGSGHLSSLKSFVTRHTRVQSVIISDRCGLRCSQRHCPS